jgi:CubicO group peptidase (beta-lactamase class C family)
MKSFIQNLILRHDLYDADVICFKHGNIVEQHTLYHPDVPHTYASDTMVRIASISKLFVAVAIMQLQEKGKIDIHDPLETYLPFIIRHPSFQNDVITIKMLLTHTASLTDTDKLYVSYGENLKEFFDPNGKYYSDSMFLSYDQKPVKPGTTYHYYNTGFQLLASIIEIVSGKRFDHYIRTHILDPLAIKGTFNPSEQTYHRMIKPTFRKNDGRWESQVDDSLPLHNYENYVLGTNGSLFSPQGGLRTNATELSKFMKFLMSGNDQVLHKMTINEMIKVHFPVNKNNSADQFCRNNGLGFNVITEGYFNRPIWEMPYRLVGHCGIAYGCLGVFFYDPIQHNGLIFITRGHGKPIETYHGHYSEYFNFQEEMFTYVDQHIWRAL